MMDKTHMTIYVKLRDSVIEEVKDYFGASCPALPFEDWKTLHFKSMVLDESDGHTIVESDHPDGYNMIILHPRTHELIWVYSIDFDFVDPPKPPLNKYKVRIKTIDIREMIIEAEDEQKAIESYASISLGEMNIIDSLDDEFLSIEKLGAE